MQTGMNGTGRHHLLQPVEAADGTVYPSKTSAVKAFLAEYPFGSASDLKSLTGWGIETSASLFEKVRKDMIASGELAEPSETKIRFESSEVESKIPIPDHGYLVFPGGVIWTGDLGDAIKIAQMFCRTAQK
jgi:hypothetical protein